MKSSIIRFLLRLYKVQAAVALTAAMALVSSCKEKDEDPTLSVAPDAAEVVFSADGGTLTAGGTAISATFNVSTNQKEWNVASSQSTWLTVTDIDKANKKFTLSAARNNTLTPPANATVTVTAGEAQAVVITVKQAAALPMLEVSPKNPVVINVDGTAATSGALVMNVKTTYPSWKAESNQTWLTVTEATDKFTLSATKNDFTVQKTATVTVTAGTITETIQVTQSANPNGMAAASTQTWKLVSQNQTHKIELSDYIEYDGKGKVAAGTITQFNFSLPEGDYRNNPDYKGYVYNLAYVKANKDKLCPAPWRVPSPDDMIKLDRALGGEGVNVETQAHVEKYLAAGFQYSGRFRNQNGGEFQLKDNVGYLTSDREFADDTNKTSHLMIRREFSGGGWAVYLENAPASSQDKTTGISLRCVRDVQ